MRRSISNLAWLGLPMETVAPRLNEAGMDGVELAPTAIWHHAPLVSAQEAHAYARRWSDEGLAISGIQSLLYGHPEFQIFDRTTWPQTIEHLKRMIAIAHNLDARIAVFGSPKNRIRGQLLPTQANEVCADFLLNLLPTLADCQVVLTLEPNAPEYGADYLTHYRDAVSLADIVNSPWVRPQIDTGCSAMVGDDPATSVAERMPAHVHVSAPRMARPPGDVHHAALRDTLVARDYTGWVVLEMLPIEPDLLETAIESARWLTTTYLSEEP